ncbi:MAG: DUF6263 family protein [Bacteroidota bacterium]
MSKLVKIAFYALSILLLSACSNKLLDLKMEATSEDEFTYRNTSMMESNVSVMGMDQKVIIEQSTDQAYDIVERNTDGSMDIKLTTLSLKMEQINPMMSMKFDSENPEENEPEEMVKGFKNMVGKEYDMKMSAKGEVIDLSTKGSVFEGAFDGVPNGEAIAAQMEEQFGVEAVKSNMAQVTGFFPDNPVQVGDSWTKNTTITSGMSMLAETTYTLTERKSGVATITFNSQLKSDPDAAPLDMMGMEMKYELTGTQTGTIKVNEKTGWTQKTEGEQKMEGKMNMSGGTVGEMSADMNTLTKYTYERIK